MTEVPERLALNKLSRSLQRLRDGARRAAAPAELPPPEASAQEPAQAAQDGQEPAQPPAD